MLVYEWVINAPLSAHLYDALVVEEPEIHATALDTDGGQLAARQMIVDLWNERHPDRILRSEDFTWQPRPEGWVRPPKSPVRGTVITSAHAPLVYDGGKWVRVNELLIHGLAAQESLEQIHDALAFEGDLYDLKKPDLLDIVKRVRDVMKNVPRTHTMVVERHENS